MTTDYVLIEVGNHLSPQRSRQVFRHFVEALFGEQRMTVVPASRDLLQRGLGLYHSRPDKDWSLTDCISITVMHEHKLTDAMSADHHFEQAGFTLLLS